MGSVHESTDDLAVIPTGRGTPMGLEVLVVPVSDVARAKAFYLNLGWRLDADSVTGDVRVVQVTPPGSSCSVVFGSHVTTASPGSYRDMHLVVRDVEAAREDLVARDVAVTEVYHCLDGDACRFSADGLAGRVVGRRPDGRSYGSFASFADPDGNEWVLQEVTTRLPGRVFAGGPAYRSVGELADALRRAAEAYREQGADADWTTWYAEHLAREQGID